jgi:sigma-B regulation protein RsbU (phosphoserine phosphatase)
MLLGMAMAQAGDSVEITDSDDRLLYVNPAFTRLTGYTPEEALGRVPAELLRSDRHDAAFFAEIEATLHAGRAWTGQIVSRHKDGHLIHQEATISPIHDARGRFTHVVAVKRDVTDRIRAEAALEESRRTHQAVLEAALDCFVGIDEAGRIVAFNSAAERTFGYSRAEALGRPLEALLMPERHRAAHKEGLARYIASPRAHPTSWAGGSRSRPRARTGARSRSRWW